jgi:hypothetical protein
VEGDSDALEEVFGPLIEARGGCVWHRSRQTWEEELAVALGTASSDPVLLLIQAPQQSVSRVWQWLEAVPGARKKVREGEVRIVTVKLEQEVVGTTGKGKRRKLHWEQGWDKIGLSHQATGGVVDYEWSFSFSFRLGTVEQRKLCLASAVRAELQDYLSPTVDGATMRKEVNKSQLPVLIPWKRKKVKVLAPCVFSSTGWVHRMMTISELLDAYDVSIADRRLMGRLTDGGPAGEMPTLSFTQQVPVRVLERVVGALRERAKGSEIQRRVGPAETDEAQVGNAGGSAASPPVWRETEQLEREVLARAGSTLAGNEETTGMEDEHRQAKNDDAVTHVVEWNLRVCRGLDGCEYQAGVHDRALDALRLLLLIRYRSWRGPLWVSFRRYMEMEHGRDWAHKVRSLRSSRRPRTRMITELLADFEVGLDAIKRATGATFWEWDNGSTLFFWRWPAEYRRAMRDGFEVCFRDSDLPKHWGRQSWPVEAKAKDQLKEKLLKVIKKGYIRKGQVHSLTGFFAVPKGTEDIRVVYDATKSGLNAAIWSPNFYLPTATTVLNNSDDTTYYGDIDLGEMFLNYFLDPQLRSRAGVDVTELAAELGEQLEPGRRLYMRWERALMGVRSSPFNCVRAYLLSEDIIRGDRRDEGNPFRWDVVVLNLPGTVKYDPSKPWVYRYDSRAKKMSAFVVSYVDDLRTGDHGRALLCDRVTHTSAARINYLGQQDASRKRKGASQNPGPWAGSVLKSREGEGLYLTISQEKWDRVKEILDRYWRQIGGEAMREKPSDNVWVDRKMLEKDTGFLVHVMMTFENLRPYLKGFYLTMNGWRYDRDPTGWKRKRDDWMEQVEEKWGDPSRWEELRSIEHGLQEKEQAPDRVRVLEQLRSDVGILREMFQKDTPALRLIRGRKTGRILYGFGDASGAGFGASWSSRVVGSEEPTGASYRFGRWGKEGDGTSSNFRELRNLVDTLDELGNQGELEGAEVFIFTDNTTAEAAFSRGSSSSRTLFELVKRLKLLEMLSGTRFHITHVAGKRMIQPGSDGLSRGCLLDGVMAGDDMLSFVPLHQSALERSPELLAWLRDNTMLQQGEEWVVLDPEGWYERGQDIVGGERNLDGVWVPTYKAGTFLWTPPPCIASQCLEELRRARHKRQLSTHVFVCPRVMSTQWLRQLHRSADVVV